MYPRQRRGVMCSPSLGMVVKGSTGSALMPRHGDRCFAPLLAVVLGELDTKYPSNGYFVGGKHIAWQRMLGMVW